MRVERGQRPPSVVCAFAARDGDSPPNDGEPRATIARGPWPRWTGVALVMVATAGCTVGPQYRAPAVSVNGAWSGAEDTRFSTQTAVDAAWWRTFDDPTLDRLVDVAARQNLVLQIAGTRILEARAELGIATAAQYPTNRNPVAGTSAGAIAPYGGGPAILYAGYQLGFDAAWEPDFWGRYRQGARAANAMALGTVAEYQGALVSVTAEVARTYLAIRTFQTLLELARENIALQEEGLQVAESRFRHGATSGLDVSQATYLLESTRATVPDFEIGLQQSQNALCTLLGQTTGCARDLLTGPAQLPTVPARVAIGIPSQLLRRRPDLRSAELYAMAQCDRIGVAMAELYPSFNLLGSLGTRTVVTTGGQSNLAGLLGIFNPGAFLVSLGASLFWPILSYPRIMNNVRVQDARLQQSLLNYQNLVLLAAQEVEDGITGFLHAQDAAAANQRAVTAARDAVQLAMVQYREGAIDYQRVLDTQRALLQSQTSLARTQSSVATNLVAVYKALGGGWELRQGQPVISDSTRAEMERRTNWGGLLSDPHPATSATPHAPSNPRR